MQTETDYSFIRKVGELTEDGVMVFDLNSGKFVYVNRNFLKIFSITKKNISDNAGLILKFIIAEDVNYLRSRYKELQAKGYINTTEFRLKFPSGLKHLSCDVLVLKKDQLVAAFIKDVTLLKLHEDFLVKYSAQKDTMLDMLTHNLNGPLQLSRDVISSIKKGYSENKLKDMSRLIEIMHENTQQCIDIVNDFLKEEHSESVHTFVKKTRFDVIEKINVTVEKLREMNKDKTFEIISGSGGLNINSDAVKFYQVIHNLLSNSIKYTMPGGTITISVTPRKSSYVICVKDTGIGIPAELKPLIFKKKLKGRPGLKGERSSGMGLSIAKKLVDIMGGKIWFESEEGRGSSFYVLLPGE